MKYVLLSLFLLGCKEYPCRSVCDEWTTIWMPMMVGDLVFMQPMDDCVSEHYEQNPKSTEICTRVNQ